MQPSSYPAPQHSETKQHPGTLHLLDEMELRELSTISNRIKWHGCNKFGSLCSLCSIDMNANV